MATFVLIHGGGDVGWSWHLVEKELRERGHDVVAPDLPCDDDAAGLPEYVDTVAAAVGERRDLVVVGQSLGGFTAPLVVDRLGAEMLVFVSGMIPAPGERPNEWTKNTGWVAGADLDDPYVAFLHDVPRPLAEEALRRSRDQSDTPSRVPWPLDALPDVPTRFVLCTEDRFFPPEFMRRVVDERLGITPDEIEASHCVALSRPRELAELLVGYLET